MRQADLENILTSRLTNRLYWRAENYRFFVWHFKDDYVRASRSKKVSVAEKVIQALAMQDPPGRFLFCFENSGPNQSTSKYYIADPKKAREKVCYSLRETCSPRPNMSEAHEQELSRIVDCLRATNSVQQHPEKFGNENTAAPCQLELNKSVSSLGVLTSPFEANSFSSVAKGSCKILRTTEQSHSLSNISFSKASAEAKSDQTGEISFLAFNPAETSLHDTPSNEQIEQIQLECPALEYFTSVNIFERQAVDDGQKCSSRPDDTKSTYRELDGGIGGRPAIDRMQSVWNGKYEDRSELKPGSAFKAVNGHQKPLSSQSVESSPGQESQLMIDDPMLSLIDSPSKTILNRDEEGLQFELTQVDAHHSSTDSSVLPPHLTTLLSGFHTENQTSGHSSVPARNMTYGHESGCSLPLFPFQNVNEMVGSATQNSLGLPRLTAGGSLTMEDVVAFLHSFIPLNHSFSEEEEEPSCCSSIDKRSPVTVLTNLEDSAASLFGKKSSRSLLDDID